jgi:ABC-type nitrate/sulfonate/bicarbonate transport system permease component
MTASRLDAWTDRLVGLASLLAVLAAVELAVRLGLTNGALVPRPTAVAQRAFDIVASGGLLAPLADTLFLLFAAYLGASAIAIVTGLAMGRFPAIHDLLEPTIESIRPLPKIALLPLLILLLGLGTPMKLTVVGLTAFFPVLINTIQGAKGVDPVLIDTARTFGHGNLTILRKIILPSAMPLILAGMRIGLALALIVVVTTEMVVGTGGLGFLIVDMQRSFKVLDMYAWLVILALVGLVLNALFVAIERRAVHWSAQDA